MFGFGKKKTQRARKTTRTPARTRKTPFRHTTTKKAAARKKKATSGSKTAAARTATPSRRVALCVICHERKQTNNAGRCGRKRCAIEARRRDRATTTPAAPAKPTAKTPTRRRAASTPRPAAARPVASPVDTAAQSNELAAWWRQARRDAHAAELKTWLANHPRHRDEVLATATQLNRVAARLELTDQHTLTHIITTLRGVTDAEIRRAAEADIAARRASSVAIRLASLGEQVGALLTKYERAGVIRLHRT